ncbi:MAG: hypothetical protein GYB65_03615 [Chloroflexi bacterium]|nr:hypothetical protein [Chloroflexota bacterium]
MVSNGPHKTTDTKPIPSNVPNDYGHLGVPGSLNMPLNHKRSRRQEGRRRVPGWVKGGIAFGLAFAGFGVVLAVFAIILYPLYFRDLPSSQQAIWTNRWNTVGGYVGQDHLGDDIRDRIITPIPPDYNPYEGIGGGHSEDDVIASLTARAVETGAVQTQQAELNLTQTVQVFQLLPPEDQQATIAVYPEATQWMVMLSPEEGTALAETQAAQTATAQPTPSQTPGGGLEIGMVPTGDGQRTADAGLAAPQATPPATLTPTASPTRQPTPIPLPQSVFLGNNVRYDTQDWNNCGPTTMSMSLSYYGWSGNQSTAASWMKPNYEDKNVSPWQMVRFVNDQTPYNALYRIGGNVQLLRRLLAAGFPVIIEEGFQPAGEDWMGHYLLLVGYNNAEGHFLAYDSYLGSNQGAGYPHTYLQLDQHWKHFNRVFIVVYDSSRENDLRVALGDYVDPGYAYAQALETAQAEIAEDNNDKWAWFNYGSAFVALDDYEAAAYAYTQAFNLDLPWRMMWYQFGPYEAYFYSGNYNDVVSLANTTQSIVDDIEESYYWEGMAYAARGDTQAAIRHFNITLDYNPNFFPARDALQRIQNGTFSVAVVGQ